MLKAYQFNHFWAILEQPTNVTLTYNIMEFYCRHFPSICYVVSIKPSSFSMHGDILLCQAI